LRIDSGVIGMESARRYTASRTQYSRFVLKERQEEKTQAGTSLLGGELEAHEEEKKQPAIGEATTDYTYDLQEKVESMRTNRPRIRSTTTDFADRFRQYTTRYIFMLLFGDDKTKKYLGEVEAQGLSLKNTATLEFTPMRQVAVSMESYYREEESVTFSSQGKVTTADGREITFSLEVGMSRTFEQYYREEYEMTEFQRLYDPLVINFDTDTAQLSDQKFFFDLDSDGAAEEISELGAGSGYLALDKNEDGRINDGSELFGPTSGNGFADLAAYDEDGNGWIDEGDSIWNKLKIWCRDENGQDNLFTLAQKGIGAICLQNVATDFALKGAENTANGFIRSTGIFLYENGNAGTLQHLDLAQ